MAFSLSFEIEKQLPYPPFSPHQKLVPIKQLIKLDKHIVCLSAYLVRIQQSNVEAVIEFSQ